MNATLLLCALCGVAVLLLVAGAAPQQLPDVERLRVRQVSRVRQGIQVRLDRAQLDVRADDFLLRGAASGGGLALFALLIVGSLALVPIGHVVVQVRRVVDHG